VGLYIGCATSNSISPTYLHITGRYRIPPTSLASGLEGFIHIETRYSQMSDVALSLSSTHSLERRSHPPASWLKITISLAFLITTDNILEYFLQRRSSSKPDESSLNSNSLEPAVYHIPLTSTGQIYLLIPKTSSWQDRRQPVMIRDRVRPRSHCIEMSIWRGTNRGDNYL
jgi:hypothetical protein